MAVAVAREHAPESAALLCRSRRQPEVTLGKVAYGRSSPPGCPFQSVWRRAGDPTVFASAGTNKQTNMENRSRLFKFFLVFLFVTFSAPGAAAVLVWVFLLLLEGIQCAWET